MSSQLVICYSEQSKQPHTTEADSVEIGKVFPNGSIFTFRRRATPKLPGFGELKQIIMVDIFSVKFSLNFAERKPKRKTKEREEEEALTGWLRAVHLIWNFGRKTKNPRLKL